MKPLLILIMAFLASLIGLKLLAHEWNCVLAGNIAMSSMLLFTAIGHFAFTKGMTMMLPDFVPFKKALVYLTGVIEVIAAIGLLIPSWQQTTAVLLIIFFVLLLPANVYAALKNVDYQKGTYDGSGPSYLWFRVPLQILFIGWVIYFDLYAHQP